MISTVKSQSPAYVQQNSPKEEISKGAPKTEKSEALDKVSALREQIQNGTYTVDIAKTAHSIAEELI